MTDTERAGSMVERMARAIQTELRRQGVLYEFDAGEPDPTTLMMSTGAAADLFAVCRAAIQVMAEPTEGMVNAGIDTEAEFDPMEPGDTEDRANLAAQFRAMIRTALEDQP